MNERIKELQFQAAAQVSPLLEGSEWQRVFTEKFAELIVRECASIAGKAEYSDTWFVPVEDTIKKHFGIEQ